MYIKDNKGKYTYQGTYNSSPSKSISETEFNNVVNSSKDKIDELKELLKTHKDDYTSSQKTILKKYSDLPKTIKKLYGVEPQMVTDGKGNTWYEFDIPKSFKEGKGEIKAFKQGGTIQTKQKKALSWISS
jgi:hypothetical protein